MASILGTRSTGCRTCRRRKVKCDEARPICKRCQRGGFGCEGFQKEIKFVDEGAKQTQSSQSRRSSGSRSQSRRQMPEPSRESPENSSHRSGNSEEEHGQAKVDLTKLMDMSAFQETIFVSFLARRMFEGSHFTRGFDNRTWISDVNRAGPTRIDYTALQCLAAAYFGRLHANSPTIMGQGARLYGKALQQLRSRIDNLATCHDPANVSATIGLTLYEMVACENEGGWIKHAGGIGVLIEMMGPEGFQEFPAHGYFLMSRPALVQNAIINRRQTFLSSDCWKTVPWHLHPETKTPYQHLLDISCDGTAIIADRVAIDTSAGRGEDTSVRETGYLLKFTKCFKDLIRWRWDWEIRNGTVAFEVPVDRLTSLAVDDRDREPLFAKLIYFRDISFAEESLAYSVCLLTLLHFWKLAQGGNPSIVPLLAMMEGESPKNMNPLLLPGKGEHEVEFGAVDVVEEICRSVEYHLRGAHENEGAFFIMGPLRVCIFTVILNQDMMQLSKNERLLRYIVRILAMIAASSGFSVAKRMLSVVPMTPPGIDGNVKGFHTDPRVEKVAQAEKLVDDPADVHLKASSSPSPLPPPATGASLSRHYRFMVHGRD